MELHLVKKVTETFKESVVLHGIDIAGKNYDLTVTNKGGRLYFSFTDNNNHRAASEEFGIQITEEKKVKFSRHQYRPYHDHDDNQTLQVDKKGELLWLTRFPYSSDGDGWEFFTVDFGPDEVSY